MSARNRVRLEGPIIGSTRVEYWSPSFISGTTYPSNLYFKSEDMDDVVIPDFHARRARGEIFNNPVEYTADSQKTTGSMSITTKRVKKLNPLTYGTDRYEWFGPGVLNATRLENFGPGSDTFDHLPITLGADTAAAVAKQFALANIDSTPYDFAEDSFEIRETLRFIRSPVKSLVDLSREYWKLVNWRKGKKLSLLKKHADAWLQYRFAFRPLIMSIDQAIDWFHDVGLERPKRRTARGVGSDSDSVGSTVREYGNYGSAAFYHEYDMKTARKYQARAGIMYEVTNPLSDWRFQLGLRNKDLPATLWEIIPYSFMVDRLVNIHNGIRGLTNLLDPNVTILAAWVTEKDEQRTTVRLADKVTPSFEVNIHGGETIERKTFSYLRNPWDPTVADAVPPITTGGLVKDAKSIADLLSIVIQNMGR